MQNWPDYECLKLPPKITRARKKRQGARLVENDNNSIKLSTKNVYFVYIFLLVIDAELSDKYRHNIYQFLPFFHRFFNAKKSSNGSV